MAGAVEPLLYSSLNETGESTECCRSATERKAWIRSAFEEIENKMEWRAKENNKENKDGGQNSCSETLIEASALPFTTTV